MENNHGAWGIAGAMRRAMNAGQWPEEPTMDQMTEAADGGQARTV